MLEIMKPNFKEIVAFLENDALAHLEVYNALTGDIIEKALNASLATTKSGSVTQYFESLYQKGVQEITVVQKRKNGTSWKEKKCPYHYSLSRKDENNARSTAAISTQTNAPVNDLFGLAGSAQQMGLSQGAMMQMYSKAEKLPEVTMERNEYRSDVKRLKAELEEERRKNMRYELGLEGRTGAGEKFMETLADPDVLTTLVSSVSDAISKSKASGLSQGASQPQELQTGSETKNALIKLISKPNVNDEMAISAYHLLSFAIQGNQEFIDGFGALVTNHQTLKTA
jgi:hypothetical protein